MTSLSEYSNQIQQHNSQPSSLALLDAGNTLFARGHVSDAMSMFDAAHIALRSPANTSDVRCQLQWAQSKLGEHAARENHNGPEIYADTYHEDECDLGPRQFRTPMLPAQGSAGIVNTFDTQLTEAFIFYNKALVLHSRFEFSEAMRLYAAAAQVISASTQDLTAAIHPKLAVLGMSIYNNMGQIAYTEGNEGVAMSNFESSLFFVRELSDVNNKELLLDTAAVLSNWCRLNWMTGDLNENVYNGLCEILRIRASILNSDHILVASAHYNLGVANYARRQNEDAVDHLMQYLQVAAQSVQKSGVSELDHIPALVFILLIKNEDQESDAVAQELVRGLRTLQEKRNDLGPNHPHVASVLNYVGTLLFHQRDFDHALLFFQEELRLEELLFHQGSVDVSVSVTCNNIGRILQELQRLPEAISYYARALQPEYGDEVLKMTAETKEGIDTAKLMPTKETQKLTRSTINLYSTIWYNLGLIYDRLRSFGEAIKAFQMSLALRRSMLGNDSADVACLMYNIAVLQMEQQLLKDATDSFREALRIRRVATTRQLNDFHVVKTLQKLASLHKSKGNIGGALEACREILQIQESSSDFDAIYRMKDMGATLREISELYYSVGDVDMAITTVRESVTLLRNLQGVSPDSINYVTCIEEMFASLLLNGSLHHERCEPEMARTLYAEACGVIRQASRHFSGVTALDALLEVSQMLATCHCSPLA